MDRVSLCVAWLLALVVTVVPAPVAARQAPEIPLVPGLKITFAVHVPDGGPAAKGVAQGDYELVVEVNSVAGDAIGLSTRVEGQDAAGKPVNVTISRRVSRQDLASARLQILGFHTSDPPGDRRQHGARPVARDPAGSQNGRIGEFLGPELPLSVDQRRHAGTSRGRR